MPPRLFSALMILIGAWTVWQSEAGARSIVETKRAPQWAFGMGEHTGNMMSVASSDIEDPGVCGLSTGETTGARRRESARRVLARHRFAYQRRWAITPSACSLTTESPFPDRGVFSRELQQATKPPLMSVSVAGSGVGVANGVRTTFP